MNWVIKLGIFIILFSVSTDTFAQEVYFNVINSNGALLRKSPYHKSNVIVKIPNGRQVRLIQDSVAVINTKKTNGVVIKISYFGQTGYGISTDFNYKATGIDLSQKIKAVKIEKNQVVEIRKKPKNNTTTPARASTKPSIQLAAKQSVQPTKRREAPANTFVQIQAKKGLNVRSKESPNSKVLGALAYKEQVRLIATVSEEFKLAGKKGNMLEIEFKGKTAYIFSGFTKKVEPKPTESTVKKGKDDFLYHAKIASSKNLNIRSESNPNSSVLTSLEPGTVVKVLDDKNKNISIGGRSGKMIKIEYQATIGYVFSPYLERTDKAMQEENEMNKVNVADHFRDTIYEVQILPTKGLNLRSTSHPKSKVLATIPHNEIIPAYSVKGKTLKIAGKKGQMLRVSYNNQVGYIFSAFTKAYAPVDASSIDTMYLVKIEVDGLNLRTTESPNSSILNILAKNLEVAVIRESEEISIKGKKGKMLMVYNGTQIGYVFSLYVSAINKVEEEEPITKQSSSQLKEETNAESANFDTLYFVKVITTKGLNLRKSTSKNSRILDQVESLAIVPVYNDSEPAIAIGGKSGKMILVEYKGKKGYIFSGFTIREEQIDFNKLEALYQVEIKTNKSLNLRMTNQSKSIVLDQIPSGTIVNVIDNKGTSIRLAGKEGIMIKVAYNNKVGYIFSGLTSKVEAKKEPLSQEEIEQKVEDLRAFEKEQEEQIKSGEINSDTAFLAKINVSALYMRASNSSKSSVIAAIKKNEVVAILDLSFNKKEAGQRPGKMIKAGFDGKIGYISSIYIEHYTPININDYEVINQSIVKSDNNLNMRSSASSTSNVITSLAPNTKIYVLDDNGETIKVGNISGKMIKVIAGDKIGYVFSGFTEKIEGTGKNETATEKKEEKKSGHNVSEELDIAIEIAEDIKEQTDANKKGLEETEKPSYSITKTDTVVDSPKEEKEIIEISKKEKKQRKEEEIKIDTLYLVKVISHAKLNVRKTADPLSDVVTRLKSLSDVAVIEESADKVKLKGKVGNMLRVYNGSNFGYVFSPYVRKHKDLVYNIVDFDTVYLARISSQNNLNLRITNDPSSAIIKSLEPSTDIAIINENSPIIKMGGRTGRMIQVYDGKDVGFVFSVFTQKIPDPEKMKELSTEEIPEYSAPTASPTSDKSEEAELRKFLEQQRKELEEIKELSLDQPTKIKEEAKPEKKEEVRPSLKNRIDDEIVEEMKLPYEVLHESLSHDYNVYEDQVNKLKVDNDFNKSELVKLYTTQQSIFLYTDASFESKPLGKIKQGTEISVLEKNVGPIVNHSTYKGRFLKVKINSYKGYIFEAYTSSIAIPKKGLTLEAYKVDQYLDKKIKNQIIDYKVPSDYLKNNEILIIPTKDIRYAYTICQNIFDIPANLEIPEVIVGEQKIINNPEKNPDLLFDNIHIKMDESEIESVTYNKKGFQVNITIFIRMNYNHIRVHVIEEKEN
jgi:uncharacterized protein YgiM (DUF1202 family)